MDFIVLCSSRGTTFQAIIDAIKLGSLHATCVGLITDRADRECVQKAKVAAIPVRIIEPIPDESQQTYEDRIIAAIHELSQDPKLVIAAMGWMKILSKHFITHFSPRIINVHPSLLPAYGGRGMFGDRVHQAVLDHQEKTSGASVHVMTEEIDTGPVLLQQSCEVKSDDTVETLKQRVQELERKLYVKVLEDLHRGLIVF